jgi:hypothetical protein
MRISQGGTQLWCPECKKTRICKAVNPSTLGEESGQRWYHTNHTDVHWFRRGRICQECEHEFLTAEVDEQFVDELCELRDALRDLKANAEAYVKQSSEASKSLATLTKSLRVLRALKVYKSA